jgi:hypothetical protein
VERPDGSIDGIGSDLEPLQINDFEMVDLKSASRNGIVEWIKRFEALEATA